MKKIASRYVVKLCLLMAPAWSISQQPAYAEIDITGNPEIPELDCVIEPSAIVDAGSSVPGLIESISVDRSDLIAEGDVLAKLESSVETASLKRARAQAGTNTSIRLREESLKLGKITEKRNAELMQISAISKQDMEQLQTESRIAELQVKQEKHNKRVAQLEYQRAQAALERLTIRSPIEGVVTDRFKAVGEYVEDEPVLRIAQIDPLFVEVVVPVDYLGAITAGMQAEVFPGAAGLASHVATVERVDRVADAASGTYGVRLSLSNPDYAIPAGLRCKLAFLPPEQSAEGSVAAADTAPLATDQGQWVLGAQMQSHQDNAANESPINISNNVSKTITSDIAAKKIAAESPPANLNQSEPLEQPALAQPEIKTVTEESVASASDSEKESTPSIAAPLQEDSKPAALLTANNVVATVTGPAVVPPVDLPAVLLQAALATKNSPISTPANFVNKLEPVNDDEPTKAARDMCYSIGPVATERLAHQLVNQVAEHIESPAKTSLMKRLRDQKKQVTSGYYVLANTEASDEAVGAYLDRLNDASVEDHMFIDRGNHKGRISLGYFHRQASANERLKLMKNQGFDAEIIERTGITHKYWLDFNGPDQNELKNNLQDIASAITPDASLQSKDCTPSVAAR